MSVNPILNLGARISRGLIRSRRIYNMLRRMILSVTYLTRTPHEADFRFFRGMPALDGPILDVGANGGQSVVSFSIFLRKPVFLCFEPNPGLHDEVSSILSRFGGKGSRLVPIALGEEDGTATLNIPRRGALPLDARASLNPVEPGAESIETVDVPVRVYDHLTAEELGAGRDPVIVKIDVEGHEGPVVRGMRGMLARAEPLLLFERSEGFSEVAEILAPLGYEMFEYDVKAHGLSALDAASASQNVFALGPGWRERCRDRGLIAAA